MEIYRNTKTLHPANLTIWREWLEVNGINEKAIFLILYKKTSNTPSITYDEAVDLALCYGWVDSKINKRDENSWYQYFARRNPKSNWSRVNKAKIERLMENGMMAKPGLDMVELAKKTGTWTALDDVENLILPQELETLFRSQPMAFDHWQLFPRSVKRGILEWIFNAKKPETKMDRIQKTVEAATINKRINFG